MSISATLECFSALALPRDDPRVLDFIEFLDNDNGTTLVTLGDVFFSRSQLGWIPDLAVALHDASRRLYGPTPLVMSLLSDLSSMRGRDDDDVELCLAIGDVSDTIDRMDMRVSVRAFAFAEEKFGDFPEFLDLLRCHMIPKFMYPPDP